MSASILTYLELTRSLVSEAYEAFRSEQDAQTNLVEILSASRFKTTGGAGFSLLSVRVASV